MSEINPDLIFKTAIGVETKKQLRDWLEKPETMQAADAAFLFHHLDSMAFLAFMEQIAAKKAKKSEPAFDLVLYAEEMGIDGALKVNLARLKRLMEQRKYGIASCIIRGTESQRSMFDLVPGLSDYVDFSSEKV